ncbi:DUF2237 domain-containing protein [Thiomicrospira microaerophila]|uniref:DUF2237 family protein n=1 Tax=Thiomicrospira microaerophila TaxID=406020 RepID=UPI00200E4C54|nr:DUF2237 domain-containing protein [Thiomicrospira microaerophila]UQB43167.1 DUF2237 domain-containing protein [Thiomicrospira microaerophila]
MKVNVLGTVLETCSTQPVTGFFRDGSCRTDDQDRGRHVVCAQVTEAFLVYSKSMGNDLTTPQPPYFQGLNPGDFWCLCALRWVEAYRAGCAPKIKLLCSDAKLLDYVDIQTLKGFAIDLN